MNNKIGIGNIRNIVHDLKTPITSIIGFVELLRKSSHDEKTTQEFYDIIASESNRLLKMVNDMLYESQNSSSGSTNNNPDICNINIEIHKYVKSLEPLAEKNNINIDINVNSGNIYVSMPEIKVARILTNILENAIKYNKEKGKVFINITEESNHFIVIIKDTGIGIAKDELDKIFNRYYRSKDLKKLGIEGSGLGLAIAKDIVESYNGSIKVTSELGQSTEFTITFPSAQIKK